MKSKIMILILMFSGMTYFAGNAMEYGAEEKVAPGTELQNKFERFKQKAIAFMNKVNEFNKQQNPKGWFEWTRSSVTLPIVTKQDILEEAQKLKKDLDLLWNEIIELVQSSYVEGKTILGTLELTNDHTFLLHFLNFLISNELISARES